MTENCAECPVPTEALVIMEGRPLCQEHYQGALQRVGALTQELLRLTQGSPEVRSLGEGDPCLPHEQVNCPECLTFRPYPPPQTYAPSEENVLHCDVPGCQASVSMVSGVPRAKHGWGRITLYDATPSDYDLCATHHQAVLDVLRGMS